MKAMESLQLKDPDIRTCEELRSVLADPDCTCEGQVYEMFRDLARNELDRRWLEDNRLRYDVTRIPGRIICGEWIKTKGHYHPLSPDGFAYPEIYEVLDGSAIYFLQKRDLSDIVMVYADKGDLVLIPPGYGHVTINRSGSTLLMANLVSSDFSSEYLPFEMNKGAAYYLFADGRIEKNTHYPDEIPQLREINASTIPQKMSFPKESLLSCIGNMEILKFLNYPGSYQTEFEDLLLQR
jgi:glucose-6-phosphate isomerase, archaeal